MKKETKVAKRGEVWLYDPGRTIGSELRKRRRGVVVSSDMMGVLSVKLVVPLTHWDERFANTAWHVKIEPDAINGVTKIVAADVLQMKSLDLERFHMYLGRVSATIMGDIVAAIAAVVEYA